MCNGVKPLCKGGGRGGQTRRQRGGESRVWGETGRPSPSPKTPANPPSASTNHHCRHHHPPTRASHPQGQGQEHYGRSADDLRRLRTPEGGALLPRGDELLGRLSIHQAPPETQDKLTRRVNRDSCVTTLLPWQISEWGETQVTNFHTISHNEVSFLSIF